MALDAGKIVAHLEIDGRKYTLGIKEAVGETGKLEKSIKTTDRSLSLFTKASAGAFAGLVTGIGLAVRESAKFETGLREIKTLGVEKSLADIGKEVTHLTTAFGQESQSVIKGYYDAISAGISESKVGGFLEEAGKLATLGVTEVSTAVDGLTSVMNAYRLAEEDAARISGRFFAAVQGGKTTIDELAGAIGRVAPSAKAFGVLEDELFAVMAAATSAGINTNEAASGLKALLINIIKPSKDAAAAAEILGIQWNQTALDKNGLIATLKQVIDATSKLTPGTKQYADMLGHLRKMVQDNTKADGTLNSEGEKYAITLGLLEKGAFTTATAFNTLLGSSEAINIGAALTGDNLEKVNQELARQANGAEELAAAYSRFIDENFAFKTSQLKQETEALARALGLPMKDALTNDVGLLADYVKGLREAAEAHPDLTFAIETSGIGATGLAAGLGTLAISIKSLKFLLPELALITGGVKSLATALFTLQAASAGVLVAGAGLAVWIASVSKELREAREGQLQDVEKQTQNEQRLRESLIGKFGRETFQQEFGRQAIALRESDLGKQLAPEDLYRIALERTSKALETTAQPLADVAQAATDAAAAQTNAAQASAQMAEAVESAAVQIGQIKWLDITRTKDTSGTVRFTDAEKSGVFREGKTPQRAATIVYTDATGERTEALIEQAAIDEVKKGGSRRGVPGGGITNTDAMAFSDMIAATVDAAKIKPADATAMSSTALADRMAELTVAMNNQRSEREQMDFRGADFTESIKARDQRMEQLVNEIAQINLAQRGIETTPAQIDVALGNVNVGEFTDVAQVKRVMLDIATRVARETVAAADAKRNT